jgi:exodeoxyribonuclease VII small subunit
MAGRKKIEYGKENLPAEDLSFEQGIEKLEKIVRELDQNQLPLEQALERFQEGIELVRRCNRLLDLAETKVKDLIDDRGEEVIPE